MSELKTFIDIHGWSLIFLLALVIDFLNIYLQFRYKNNGILLDGEIIGYRNKWGTPFATYRLNYNGQIIEKDGFFSDKTHVGTIEKILYLPGNLKWVMRIQDTKIKSWEIILPIILIAYIILDFFVVKH